MRQNLMLMAAWYKLHASIHERGRLQGDPDAERIVAQRWVPIGLVLVPGCLHTMARRFEDGVLALRLRLGAKQLLGDRQRVGAEQPVQELRRIFARPENLRQRRRVVVRIGTGQVELVASL